MGVRAFSIVDYVSKLVDWLLFILTLIFSFACLIVTFDVYCFLVVICVSLFSLPRVWFRFEFKWRLVFFLLAGALFIVLFAQHSAYIYVLGVAIPLALLILLFIEGVKWRFSRYVNSIDFLFLAILFVIIALLAGFGLTQLREHLIGIAGFFIMVFMLRHVCAAMNRTTLLECLPKVEDIKDPVDFIEKILEKKSEISQEERDFIRFRFNEFLKYMERSEYEQAYVTLATGTLELLQVWSEKMYKEAWENIKDVNHDDLRGAIVHSTPKEKKKIKKKEELIKNLEMKRKILKRFMQDPITPIKDLLDALAKKYLC